MPVRLPLRVNIMRVVSAFDVTNVFLNYSRARSQINSRCPCARPRLRIYTYIYYTVNVHIQVLFHRRGQHQPLSLKAGDETRGV